MEAELVVAEIVRTAIEVVDGESARNYRLSVDAIRNAHSRIEVSEDDVGAIVAALLRYDCEIRIFPHDAQSAENLIQILYADKKNFEFDGQIAIMGNKLYTMCALRNFHEDFRYAIYQSVI